MPTLFTYKDLQAWRQGIELVVFCYELTKSFPRSELYGLTGQIRRAAVSIPSNVAEGHCRRTRGAFANHVSIALGSHGELDTCLEIAFRLSYITGRQKADALNIADSVGRILYGLHRSLVDS